MSSLGTFPRQQVSLPFFSLSLLLPRDQHDGIASQQEGMSLRIIAVRQVSAAGEQHLFYLFHINAVQ